MYVSNLETLLDCDRWRTCFVSASIWKALQSPTEAQTKAQFVLPGTSIVQPEQQPEQQPEHDTFQTMCACVVCQKHN
jgi:hypothetical protein